MIRLDSLAHLVAAPGPYATAYVDATRKTEEGAEEVALRWRALREDLARHGADHATLDAMSAALAEPDHLPGEHGRVLVGRDGRVRYDAALPQPPRWQSSRWSPLPHLMPMVAQLAPLVPHVVAVVDRTGGDVEVTGPHGQEEREVAGREWPVHKAGAGGWSSLRYQHRTEHTWKANARAVADEVDSAVRRVGARLVVVAGDVRERAELLEELGEAARAVAVEVEEGSRHAGADPEALRRRVDQLVAEVAARDDLAVIDRFTEARGRALAGVDDVLAVAGVLDTIEAFQKAQVEHLLIVDDPSSEAEAWVGPEPVLLGRDFPAVQALGVTDPVRDRLDAALVRAAAGTDAAVVSLAPGQLQLPDGIGATLRYPDPRP